MLSFPLIRSRWLYCRGPWRSALFLSIAFPTSQGIRSHGRPFLSRRFQVSDRVHGLGIPCSYIQCASWFQVPETSSARGLGRTVFRVLTTPVACHLRLPISTPPGLPLDWFSVPLEPGRPVFTGVSWSGQVRPLSLYSYNCLVHGSHNGHGSLLFVAVQEVGIQIPSSRLFGGLFNCWEGEFTVFEACPVLCIITSYPWSLSVFSLGCSVANVGSSLLLRRLVPILQC